MLDEILKVYDHINKIRKYNSDTESDEENLNMAIKMSLNDEMEIDEDYSFKKIYDNLINYFENKENRNNSKDSVNDFFNKFLNNEENKII